VFITGHTGFKGGWLALWLSTLGAKVYGYSLEPPTTKNFFSIINLRDILCNSIMGDIRDSSRLVNSMKEAKPSIIFHMAAQPLVRHSYHDPVSTFATNVIGTVNVFEAARKINTVEAIINITTDKCYENNEQDRPYSESDRLGGYDPYSSSKACSEIVTSAYRNSFFNQTQIKLASARAGNVIGGGDWATDRLIPDFFRSIENNETLLIRSPQAVRPWQHVLDPLSGYLVLAEKLVIDKSNFAEAWNFGPEDTGAKTVSWVLERLTKKFENARWKKENSKHHHEANILKLDISKAKSKLNWFPKWSLEQSIDNTVDWYKIFQNNNKMREFSIKQIKIYEAT
jgi:CDP-glucose 4,6-dehydratase